jgi:hypothetical protein
MTQRKRQFVYKYSPVLNLSIARILCRSTIFGIYKNAKIIQNKKTELLCSAFLLYSFISLENVLYCFFAMFIFKKNIWLNLNTSLLPINQYPVWYLDFC